LCYTEESKGDTQDAAVRLNTYIYFYRLDTWGGEGWTVDALAVVGVGMRQGPQSLVYHEDAAVPMG
jgi:hypothetical protein